MSFANISYSFQVPSKFLFAFFSCGPCQGQMHLIICNALWFHNLTNPGNGNLLNRFACCFQIVLFFPFPVCVSMNVPEPPCSLSLPFGKQKFSQCPSYPTSAFWKQFGFVLRWERLLSQVMSLSGDPCLSLCWENQASTVSGTRRARSLPPGL